MTFECFSAINGSEAGLVLSTLFMATLVHFLALQSAETENNLISVKRIMAYGQLQPEAPLESTEGKITHIIIYMKCQMRGDLHLYQL